MGDCGIKSVRLFMILCTVPALDALYALAQSNYSHLRIGLVIFPINPGVPDVRCAGHSFWFSVITSMRSAVKLAAISTVSGNSRAAWAVTRAARGEGADSVGDGMDGTDSTNSGEPARDRGRRPSIVCGTRDGMVVVVRAGVVRCAASRACVSQGHSLGCKASQRTP